MRLSTKTKVFVGIVCVCLAGGMYLLLKVAHRDSTDHSPLSAKNERSQDRKDQTLRREPSPDTSGIDDGFKEFHQTVGDQVSRDLMEKGLFELKQRDPREFVRRSDHEISPTLVRKLLTQGSLPALYALLDDPAYRQYWANVAKTICYLSDDPRSAPIIIKYIRRSDDWKQGDIAASFECAGKIKTLTWLGFLGGEEAERVLMKAMTPDGVKELTKAWINGPLPVWATKPDSEIVSFIQGSAAIGIVHSQSQQGIRKAEASYAAARTDSQQLGYFTPQFKETARAMAIRDLIQSIGMDAYLNRVDDPGYYQFTILPRAEEYMRIEK